MKFKKEGGTLAKRKKSYKEKRLERKKLRSSNTFEDRYNLVRKIGLSKILDKWNAGRGRSRHQGKKEGDIFRYITSEKTFRDVSATWDRFARYVAENAKEGEIKGLEDVFEYVDPYLESLEQKGRSAWTLTTYKANLGKVFEVSTTAFKETPPRERANIVRSRKEVKRDSRISDERRSFFEKYGSALGLRRQEMEQIRGVDLIDQRFDTGFYYIEVSRGTKGGKTRTVPIMAKSEEELQEILRAFRQAGNRRVFHGVPSSFDEHEQRAEYAKRVYLHYERDLDKIPSSEITFLRKEMKGTRLDKAAERFASRYLGHERGGEFRKSYAWKLWQE